LKESNDMPLFLVEYYTTDPVSKTTGWDIRFAWVWAPDSDAARLKVSTLPDFDCVIAARPHSEVFPLALGDEPQPAVMFA
jgi:hypothetical protein